MNPMLRLRVFIDCQRPQDHAFEALPLTIGRDPKNALQIQDAFVSRFHAVLELRERKLVLTDLGSLNGTFVDGRQIPSGATSVLQTYPLVFQLGTLVRVALLAGIHAPSLIGLAGRSERAREPRDVQSRLRLIQAEDTPAPDRTGA